MRVDASALSGAPPGQRSGPQGIPEAAHKGNRSTLTNVTDSNILTLVRAETCHRCKWRGLVFPDGGRRCYTHATDADLRLVDELEEIAAALGALPRSRHVDEWGVRTRFPYGPNVDVPARARLLTWAAGHRLTWAPDRRDLAWLRTGRRGSWNNHPPAWMDHVSCWTRDGAPALLLAQPYHLSAEDVDELAALDTEAALRVELRAEGSWYKNGTWAVEVWRAAA